jgi:hypothetical protein
MNIKNLNSKTDMDMFVIKPFFFSLEKTMEKLAHYFL